MQFPEKLLDAKPEDSLQTIADIAKERIRRAGQKILAENADKPGIETLDIGFRVLKVDSSNLKEVKYRPDELEQSFLDSLQDNLKADRSAEDLLFQVLLNWGVDLTLPITRETILGREVFCVDQNTLLACFAEKVDEELVRALAQRAPLRVVFKDACFENDSAKINAEQIFKLLSPGSEVRTI